MKRINLPDMVMRSESDCRAICLKQVVDYCGVKSELSDINSYCTDSRKFRDWDYFLGEYALQNGLAATVHTRALGIFDPTWFSLNKEDLIKKLELKKKELERLARTHPGFLKFELEASHAIKFLHMGGKIDFSPFSNSLIKTYLARGTPVIATITGQLVYDLPKERDSVDDDVSGDPWKHSVTIGGFDRRKYTVWDPSNVIDRRKYRINEDFLLDAVVRYDSNLLVVSAR